MAYSDANGQFSITAVAFGGFDTADLFHAVKDGYVSQSRTLGSGLSFVLAALAPAVSIGGEYNLTITADAACAALPADMRTRTYVAHFAGGPNIALGSLHGAAFVAGRAELDAYITGNVVRFTTDVHGPGWIVEEVGPSRYFALRGVATARVGTPASAISAAFEGRIEYCTAHVSLRPEYACAATHARSCLSGNHQFVLTR